VALLPIIDAFPHFVAVQEGLYDQAGVEVEMLPVNSALMRDQLMQAHTVDGMLSEMTVAGNFNRDKVRVKLVGNMRAATPRFPMFRILAAPQTGVRSPGDLAGVPVAISKGTIIEYVTDRLLASAKVPTEQIVTRSVPAIPERYQLLMQSRVPAGTLPDPLGLNAIQQGARLVIDDTAFPQYSVSSFCFSARSLETRPEAVRRFLAAWYEAVDLVNSDPESFRGLLVEKVRMPPPVQGSYPIPVFSGPSVPSREQWDDVMAWMTQKKLLEAPLDYEASVTPAYLPDYEARVPAE
jgi:NitT/TauT family transport system substrate-binding protein